MISVTEIAKRKIVEAAEENGYGQNTYVRVKVIGGGCAGFMYDMTFLEEEEKNVNGEYEEVLNVDGAFKIVVDGISAQYVEDTTIDWFTSINGEGFKFVNPNATSCGCGKSFSTE